MFKIIIEILLIIISIYAVIFNKKKLIIFLIGFTVTIDIFQIHLFGPTMQIYQFLGILLLPKSIHFAIQYFSKKHAVRLLILWLVMLIFLAIIYGYIFPWEDLTGIRMWSQTAQGRALVQIARYVSILSMIFYLAKVLRDRNNLFWLLRGFYSGLIINVIFALIDFATEGQLSYIIFNREIFGSRFTGLNGEPRALGRICALGMLVSFFEIFNSRNMRLCVFSFGIIGFILAGSTSALIAIIITMITILFKNILNKKLNKTFIGFFILIIISIIVVSLNLSIVNDYILPRINRIIEKEDRGFNEPSLFASLEVFDRAALRFLYANPQYALFGTGPNLISIPASQYISFRASHIWGSRIDSVPHMGLIQIFSSYGFVGLFLWMVIIFSIYNTLRRRHSIFDRNLSEIFFIVSIFSMIVMTDFFYIFLGLSLGYLINKDEPMEV